jgi:hypothetical protein
MGDGGNGGLGGSIGIECEPGSMRDCYGGPPGTENVGACTVGSEQCNGDGSDWAGCVGEVLPSMELPTPQGETPVDEDCDGMIDEPSDVFGKFLLQAELRPHDPITWSFPCRDARPILPRK